MAGLRQAQIDPLHTFANAEGKGHAESWPRFPLERKVSHSATQAQSRGQSNSI